MMTGITTTAEQLRAASFLDGREPFGTTTLAVPFATVLDAAAPLPDASVPMIFHVSFCRSTLLSRLLDVPGAVRVLREPRVQIDLANWRAVLPDAFADKDYLPLLRAVTRLLGRAGPVGERAIVKPTNWANILLPDLPVRTSAVLPVFLTMEPRAFLRAVFRGGRERIAFTIRAAQHFATRSVGARARVAAAVAANADPLDRAARLTLLALDFQLHLFGPDTASRIDEAAIRTDPIAAATRAARLLQLPLSDVAIAAHAETMLARHAKAPSAAFHQDTEGGADALVEHHHGARFDAALTWYGRQAT